MKADKYNKENNKCDHLLGLDSYGNRIYMSDNEEEAVLDDFNYCPECGEKNLLTTTNPEELNK